MNLPIYEIADQLCEILRHSQALLLTAPTGSGKSTQIPQIVLPLLPENQRILVLQPRRLAARMLAERVAEEMNCTIGSLVGYQTRFEHQISKQTRICFITEGILSRMLISNPKLTGYGVLIFDEFHERSIYTDLGLAMAWHTCQTIRPDLKLIVMSATIDPKPVQAYLGNCPLLHSEGRLYEVAIQYTRNAGKFSISRLAANAVRDVLTAGLLGDILVFMPGAGEINDCVRECKKSCGGGERLDILPLYGSMTGDAQRTVMRPSENRKIIIATNIAETSLTIPGIRHVIDSGLCRQNRYEPGRGINVLELQPISRDSADQRAGRAGREAPGTCRRLWSPLEQNGKPTRTMPEIQRVDLADVILILNSFGFANPGDFPWFEDPPEKAIRAAQFLLERLGILKPDYGGLTERGMQIQRFPVHPRVALLLWLGARNGCYRDAAWAAALFSGRPLIMDGATSRAQLADYCRQIKHANSEKQTPSDFLGQIELLQWARNARFNYNDCCRLGIHAGAAREICRVANYYMQMQPRTEVVAEGKRLSLQQCLLYVLSDHLARRCDEGTLCCELSGRKRANLSRNSIVRNNTLLVAGEIRDFNAGKNSAVKLELSLATGIQEEWLWDFFPDDFEERDEVFYDEFKQQVLRRRTLSCLDLVLEETIRNDAPDEEAAALLTKQIMQNGLHLPKWDDSVTQWILRVQWVAGVFPKENLPLYSEEDREKILLDYCYGEYAYKKLRNKPCLAYVKNLLRPEQIAFVEKMAPTHFSLPAKKGRMKIEYTPGQPPKGSARIEDLYGVQGALKVADGKVPVLLDILAPNMRTVQITDDLERFWAVHYPKLRPALSRRYPKHKWI